MLFQRSRIRSELEHISSEFEAPFQESPGFLFFIFFFRFLQELQLFFGRLTIKLGLKMIMPCFQNLCSTHLLEFLSHSRGNLTISHIFVSTSVIFCSCPAVCMPWLGMLGIFYSKTTIQTVLYFSIVLFEILT